MSDNKLTKKQNLLQGVKFALFSASAGIIEVASFALFNEVAELPYWPAYLIALALSVLYNFTLNRRFTFKSANNIPVAMLKVALFYCVFTPLSTWGGARVEAMGVNEYIVLACTMALNFVTEFLFCRFIVYRGSINTNDLAQKELEKEKEKEKGENK
ncbi:MAG: GtrA family protein [Clostridiales bacterium]|jgi:putative flippase GtrA|nr:GtrA family protein [Clostridiales bacterium]